MQPTIQGMTRQRLIELANLRTGKIGAKLNLDGEFLSVLQEFCSSHRWYWRKRSITFDTVAGTPVYDLGAGVIDALDCEEIISVKIIKTADQISKLDPVYGIDEQEKAMESETQDEPTRFFIEPGTVNNLRLAPIPNGVYKVRVAFWAVPNTTLDQQSANIPLVPGNLHYILVKGLEAQIFRYALGQGDKNYLAAQSEYTSLRDEAAKRNSFATGLGRTFTHNDTAIRST